jgi:hypothetical protein
VAPAYAQQQTPPPAQSPAQTREHTVKRGDTLWDLARAYLSNPFLWPLIYDANRQVVENPHRIYPAERLVIPPLPGEKPKPEAEPAQPQAVAIVPNPQPQPPAGPAAHAAQPGARRTRFYSPPDTTTEPTLITAGILAARRVEPKEYYSSPWLADGGRLPVLGRVFKPAEPRSEASLLGTTFHPFDRMYLNFEGRTRPRVGDMLLIVSVGRGVGGFGQIIQPRGVVRIDSIHTSTMLAMVTHQFGNLELGDLALPMDSFPSMSGQVTNVDDGPQGSLIEFLVPQPVYGTQDIAFVNLGSARGVKVGDELIVQLPARSRDSRLPAQPIARLLVTRVTERSATVRVIHLEDAVLKEGLPVRLVARMQ